MKTSVLSICSSLILLCSCATAPLPTESKIGYSPATGLINLSLPKDASWAWMEFHQTIGTNQISLVISNGIFKNNPLVLDAVAAGYVGMINAMGGLINTAIAAGAAGAGKVVLPVAAPATTTVDPDGTITIKHP